MTAMSKDKPCIGNRPCALSHAHGVERRDDACRGDGSGLASRMRDGAHHRADNRRALELVIAVGPDRHQPANVVVNPLFSLHQATSLEAYLPGRAVAD